MLTCAILMTYRIPKGTSDEDGTDRSLIDERLDSGTEDEGGYSYILPPPTMANLDSIQEIVRKRLF